MIYRRILTPLFRRHGTGVLLLAVLSAVSPQAAFAASPAADSSPIFRFQTDGFWLNLHHFLYVLGRAEAGLSDRDRAAVAGAPDDQERGLQTVDAETRQRWRDAVSTYAEGPSQLDAVFEESLYTLAGHLAQVGDVLDPPELEIPWRAALEQAAPIYREVWWAEHKAANRAWVESLEPLLVKHGPPIRDFLTRAVGLPWPKDGFPVQLSGYSNWAGAYSTHGELLVVSSLDSRLQGNTLGLEMVFHESMHQWDAARFEALVAAAKARRVRFPRGLSHSLLFFTAGEAVRATVPGHVPYADHFGLWNRGSSADFLPILERVWRPFLHGVVSRDRALDQLMGYFEKPDPE